MVSGSHMPGGCFGSFRTEAIRKKVWSIFLQEKTGRNKLSGRFVHGRRVLFRRFLSGRDAGNSGKYPDMKVVVRNYGTAASVLENTSYKKMTESADIVMVLYGLNNYLSGRTRKNFRGQY